MESRVVGVASTVRGDRKSTRLNSSHPSISYAVFCLKKTTSTRHENKDHALGFGREIRLFRSQLILERLFRFRRLYSVIFFFNDRATTEIYTLSLHDALPI